MTDFREETSGTTGMQQRNKGPRHKMVTTSEEGEDNRQRHQRTKQETGATSGKREALGQTIVLEIAKRVKALWRSRQSPKRKKRLQAAEEPEM
jgi:hypothetical protein